MWTTWTSWLDRVSLRLLAILAVLMAMAPWPAGDQPHLIQKIQMLSAGELTRPLDIFDLFAHGFPLLLLVVKIARVALKSEEEGDDAPDTDGD
jgi:hypothetical protein